ECERHLLAVWPLRLLLERRAPDEIVVELHVRPVAEVPGRQVVVLDVRRVEAAANRRLRLVAVGREPLPVRLQLLARIDGGERRWHPARLQRVGRIRASADEAEAELLARFGNGVANQVVL